MFPEGPSSLNFFSFDCEFIFIITLSMGISPDPPLSTYSIMVIFLQSSNLFLVHHGIEVSILLEVL